MSDYNKFKANFEYQQKVAAKGFGDTVEKITKATGIKKVVDTVAEALDADCGCDKRKKKLNELFPYKMPELFTEQEFLYTYLCNFRCWIITSYKTILSNTWAFMYINS